LLREAAVSLMIIQINDVSKVYPVYDKNIKKNFLDKFLLNRTSEKKALDQVSFSISEGEFVGLLGPNGAGKSSLIKLLSGVMAPSSGTIDVCGLDPVKNRIQHARNIGVLFGQKTQLWWDLPLIYSLRLLGDIYNIPPRIRDLKIEELIDIIDLSSFINRPVRQLSLGERMRGEIAATLIHEPSILFLDEPTIGLDVVSKFNLQNLLREINTKIKTTVILTTHNVDDIEKLCKRVVFINNGRLIYDDSISKLMHVSNEKKYIVVETDSNILKNVIHWEKREANKYWIPITDDNQIYYYLETLKKLSINVKSFVIAKPQLEEIIRELYLLHKVVV
jgi:ABC-2 type transport system ATP-binding protein